MQDSSLPSGILKNWGVGGCHPNEWDTMKPAVLICASKPLFGQLYELDQVDQNIDPRSSANV